MYSTHQQTHAPAGYGHGHGHSHSHDHPHAHGAAPSGRKPGMINLDKITSNSLPLGYMLPILSIYNANSVQSVDSFSSRIPAR